jgi:TonB family protein
MIQRHFAALGAVGMLVASACATGQTLPLDPVPCLSPEGEDLPRPEVWPVPVNRSEIGRAFEAQYGPLLGLRLSGRAGACVLVDETGEVVATRLETSSGAPEIDRAALEVVQVMQFEPARRGDQPMRVAVVIPISFEIR